MKPLVSVITSTKRPGSLDVLVDDLLRQTVWQRLIDAHQVEWILVDEFANDPERRAAFEQACAALGDLPHQHLYPPDYDTPHFCKLARANQLALKTARGQYCFFLNDFISCPDVTLERLLAVMAQSDGHALATCICHHAAIPPLEAVTRPDDPYSIFETPFTAKDYDGQPIPLTWTDPRVNDESQSRSPFQWEASVAMASRELLLASGGWIEEMDAASAYDNCQVALAVLAHDPQASVVVLKDVVCWSLPHSRYQPNRPDHDVWGLRNRDRFGVYAHDLNLQSRGQLLNADKPSIAFVVDSTGAWGAIDPRNPLAKPLGGRETAAIRLAQELAQKGWHTGVVAPLTVPRYYGEDIVWRSVTKEAVRLLSRYDVVVSLDNADVFRRVRAKVNVLHCQYASPPRPIDAALAAKIDHVALLSDYQRVSLCEQAPLNPDTMVRFGNGVDLARYDQQVEKVPGRLVWSSSPDRGLHHLLRWWPTLKERFPHLSLKVFYRVDALGGVKWTHEMRAEWARIIEQGAALDSVEYVGPVDQLTLAREQLAAELFVYPCDPSAPTETFAISVIEFMAARVPCLLSTADCLEELYGTYAHTLAVPIQDELWIAGISKLLTEPELRDKYVDAARSFAERQSWANVAGKWDAWLRQRLTLTDPGDIVDACEDATYGAPPELRAVAVPT